MTDNSIAGLAILFLFGGPVAAWIIHRVFAHAEYMAMIRNGMTPPLDPRAMRRAAKYGWAPPPPGNAWGAPPPQQVAAPNAYGEYASYYAQRQLHRGMVTAFVGLAILIGLSFINPGHVGPWLLGGLIPMFVGLAQIITAVMSGAQFGIPSANAAGQGFGPPGQPGVFGQQQQTQAPPPPPPPPTPDSYGAWRPGSMPRIEKPASPPDQR